MNVERETGAELEELKPWVEPKIDRLEVERTLTRPGRGPDGWEYPDCTHS